MLGSRQYHTLGSEKGGAVKAIQLFGKQLQTYQFFVTWKSWRYRTGNRPTLWLIAFLIWFCLSISQMWSFPVNACSFRAVLASFDAHKSLQVFFGLWQAHHYKLWRGDCSKLGFVQKYKEEFRSRKWLAQIQGKYPKMSLKTLSAPEFKWMYLLRAWCHCWRPQACLYACHSRGGL